MSDQNMSEEILKNESTAVQPQEGTVTTVPAEGTSESSQKSVTQKEAETEVSKSEVPKAEVPKAAESEAAKKQWSPIPEKLRIITSAHLKWIAIITMFIDHLGATMVEGNPNIESSLLLNLLDILMRSIGRIAFPIFIFMMVEGLFYTKSRGMYLLRMFILALISHIPFNMAFFLTNQDILVSHKFVTWENTSVFATLFLGLLAMTVMELIREKLKIHLVLKILLCIPVGLLCVLAAELLHTDYAGLGVMAILVCYVTTLLLRKWYTVRFCTTSIALTCGNCFEIASIVAFPVFLFYNGKKGKNLNKWFFYFFYPAHLLLLACLRLLVYGA